MPLFPYADKPTVHLWQSKGLGLILSFDSGVLYSNQTGGYACYHPAVEGIYVPLIDEMVDQEQELYTYFTGPKWQGWCNEKIDEETAQFVDRVLAKSPHSQMLKVDRDYLDHSHEAWIYVEVDLENEEAYTDLFSELSAIKGVLTWQNSD